MKFSTGGDMTTSGEFQANISLQAFPRIETKVTIKKVLVSNFILSSSILAYYSINAVLLHQCWQSNSVKGTIFMKM